MSKSIKVLELLACDRCRISCYSLFSKKVTGNFISFMGYSDRRPNAFPIRRIYHHKMIVVPEDDGGERDTVHDIVNGALDGQRTQSTAFSTGAEVE